MLKIDASDESWVIFFSWGCLITDIISKIAKAVDTREFFVEVWKLKQCALQHYQTSKTTPPVYQRVFFLVKFMTLKIFTWISSMQSIFKNLQKHIIFHMPFRLPPQLTTCCLTPDWWLLPLWFYIVALKNWALSFHHKINASSRDRKNFKTSNSVAFLVSL